MIGELAHVQPRAPEVGGLVDLSATLRSASAGTARVSPLQLSAANADSPSFSRVNATADRPSRPMRMSVVRRSVGSLLAAASDRLGPSGTGVLPPAVGASVVERRLAVQHEVDLSLDASDDPQQHVLGPVVAGRAPISLGALVVAPRTHHERVAHDEPPGARLPRRLEHVRARHVAASGGHEQFGRSESEGAGGTIQDRPEDARAVGPGHAQPLDAAARADERRDLAVAQEPVLRDRRKRAVVALQRGDDPPCGGGSAGPAGERRWRCSRVASVAPCRANTRISADGSSRLVPTVGGPRGRAAGLRRHAQPDRG